MSCTLSVLQILAILGSFSLGFPVLEHPGDQKRAAFCLTAFFGMMEACG